MSKSNNFVFVENEFCAEKNPASETLFSLSNGFIGIRGNHIEGNLKNSVNGSYINGFFESHPIHYGEKLYGYAENAQTILNVADAKIIRVSVDGEEFNIETSSFTDYSRELDIRTGIVKRSLIWNTLTGQKIKIITERLVSFEEKKLAAVKYFIDPVDCNSDITLNSFINGDVSNISSADDPRVGAGFIGPILYPKSNDFENEKVVLVQETKYSGKLLGCGIKNEIKSGNVSSITEINNLNVYGYSYVFKPNQKIEVEKYIAYETNYESMISDLNIEVERVLSFAQKIGWDELVKGQKKFLTKFWKTANIEIEGDDELQQGISFNMFHVLQATGRDGLTNIAAKGLTGEGYEGHYFWDTETYVIPMFIYTNPDIAKQLLIYRYNTLPKARDRARQMNHNKGALFPWRTINGEECSAFFPAGTAQYHINADIAFAVKRYYEATDDIEFIINYGAEIVIETARLWADLGDFIFHKGNKFCINDVTGPDEYTCIVNNNAYTNFLAAENMNFAYEIIQILKSDYFSTYEYLVTELKLEENEFYYWKKAASDMYYPYDEKSGLYMQDDSFFDKEIWDFENTPPEKYPLLLHYHPLVIYRYQVCKQADLILAELLLSDKFSLEQKKRDYDYYEKITTHDSSLSTCIFSIMAAEVGYVDKAYDYFYDTVRTDIDNKKGNTKDGIHAANMAGTWSAIVFGLGGVRINKGVLHINPVLPEKMRGYSFNIFFKGHHIKVSKTLDSVDVKLQTEGAVDIVINDQITTITNE